MPDPVKEVGYELATQAMQMPTGNVKELRTPQYGLQPSLPFGLNLNDNQKERLAPYKVGWTA